MNLRSISKSVTPSRNCPSQRAACPPISTISRATHWSVSTQSSRAGSTYTEGRTATAPTLCSRRQTRTRLVVAEPGKFGISITQRIPGARSGGLAVRFARRPTSLRSRRRRRSRSHRHRSAGAELLAPALRDDVACAQLAEHFEQALHRNTALDLDLLGLHVLDAHHE